MPMTPSTPTSYTPNLLIGLFNDGDTPGQSELNGMRNKIDRLVFTVGVLSSRPVHAVTVPPRWYYATDAGNGKLYRDDPVLGWIVMLENINAAAVASGMRYCGIWDASSGSYPTSAIQGDVYKISVEGVIDGITFYVSDHIIYNGSGWDHIENSEVKSPADYLTQDQIDHLQYQDTGSHPIGEIPEFDSQGNLTTSGKTSADIDAKMTKITAIIQDNLLSMGSTGDAEDSGISKTAITQLQADLDTAETDIDNLETAVGSLQADVDELESTFSGIEGKMDKLETPEEDEIIISDDTGNAKNSGVKIAAVVNNTDTEIPTSLAVGTYAPQRATYPTEDNLKTFDADGNDKDSGIPASSLTGKPDFTADFTPKGMDLVESTEVPEEGLVLTNGSLEIGWLNVGDGFLGQIRMPADLDKDDDLNIEMMVTPEDDESGTKYVQFACSIYAQDSTYNLDAAPVVKNTGDLPVGNDLQKTYQIDTSDTISSFGILDSKLVRFKIVRIACSAETDLAGRVGISSLRLRAKRA